MIYLTIVFLCTAGLFLALLEDRFRIWTTLGVTAGAYLLALGAAFLVRRAVRGPILGEQFPCAVGCAVFFVVSLFLWRNNPLQKLFIALLSLCDFAFLGFFIPLLLGAMPFSTAGAFAGVFSVLAYCLFTLLMGLCLYRPFRHFSDRGESGTVLAMCLLVLLIYLFSLGRLDFLFRTNVPAARLLACVLLYALLVFVFRAVYQAGRFRERAALETARTWMLEMESGDFEDMLAAVRQVRTAEKNGEYALDTVNVMLADGYGEKIPAYVEIAKRNAAQNPMLTEYHQNPYVNGVIAVKAAFAAQHGIDFQCNAVTGDCFLTTPELCVIVNEMLTRACQDAAAFSGEKHLRFTAFPGEGSLRLETVYSADRPKEEKFSLRGKTVSQVLQWLFDDSPREKDDLRGLENTQEIIGRYSGKLTVSGTAEETILQASLRL